MNVPWHMISLWQRYPFYFGKGKVLLLRCTFSWLQCLPLYQQHRRETGNLYAFIIVYLPSSSAHKSQIKIVDFYTVLCAVFGSRGDEESNFFKCVFVASLCGKLNWEHFGVFQSFNIRRCLSWKIIVLLLPDFELHKRILSNYSFLNLYTFVILIFSRCLRSCEYNFRF